MSSEFQPGQFETQIVNPSSFWIDNKIVYASAKLIDPISLAFCALLCSRANNTTERCYRLSHQRITTTLGNLVCSSRRRLPLLQELGLICILVTRSYEECTFELLQMPELIKYRTAPLVLQGLLRPLP